MVKCSAVRIKELMAADGWRGLRGGKEPHGTKAGMVSVLLGQSVKEAFIEYLGRVNVSGSSPTSASGRRVRHPAVEEGDILPCHKYMACNV